MTAKLKAVQDAVSFCGTQAELASRLTAILGRDIKGGHVYYWLKNGVGPDDAPAFELVTDGAVRCQDLCPEVQWRRTAAGRVTGYIVSVSKPTERAA